MVKLTSLGAVDKLNVSANQGRLASLLLANAVTL